MKGMRLLLAALVVLVAAFIVMTGPAQIPAQAEPVAAAAKESKSSGVMSVADDVLSSMDMKADPCQNFYRYACGNWIDNTEIPSDQPIWGRSFSEIAERNRTNLRAILDDAVKNPSGDEGAKKLGAYYGSCMDEAAIEKAGAKPLEPMLKEIAKVKDVKTLMTVTAKLHQSGLNVLFRGGSSPDYKDPELNIAEYTQGGLGLPERDYYLRDDEKSVALQEEYKAHMSRMLQLLGEDEATAKKHTEAVYGFEMELAKVSRPRVELRDPDKTYNKLDLDGLKKLTPEIPWESFLSTLGYPKVQQINVTVPEFFEGLQKAAGAADAETLQAYLRWNLVTRTADMLSKDFVNENFAFFGQELLGQKELKARWKRCVTATNGAMGELLGQAFVKKHFPGDSKTIALDLIQRIQVAFEGSLAGLDWMDDTTRKRALEKKGTLKNKIGYPDKWRDYSKLAVKKADYFGNVMASNRFDFEYDYGKIEKPVDKDEWFMPPSMVNAYYNPQWNEMVFPAGILQPPFFDREFPMALNFGAIGMVMGHELTHGFDDQGRKFAPDGKLKEWWEPEVAAKFDERAKCVSDLYSSYVVEEGLNVNGELTLGENIADLGGIKQAFMSYKNWAKDNPKKDQAAVEGLTNDQLFFVGFGQVWCVKQTPEIARMRANVDTHSPPKYRVNGPLANLDAFAEAFSCKEGTPMRPKDACEVW